MTTTTKTTTKTTAADRYMVQREKALETLRRIEMALQADMDSTNPDDCHFGHVGHLASLNEALDTAASIMTGEEV